MDHSERSPRGWWSSARLLWVIAALLLAQGIVKAVTGTARAWGENADVDLEVRSREYEWFRQGVYPHVDVERPPDLKRATGSVYPPYAFPMMAAYFEPGGLAQGRIVQLVLSIGSLVVIGAYCARTLRPWGLPIAAVGAASAIAISGNKGVFSLGQFSLVCMALIALQMSLLARGRPLAGGICWAFAMLKPHVALPFAALFLLRRRQVRGLVLGLGLLAALSWFACAWTGIEVGLLVNHWTSDMSLRFSGRGMIVSPGTLAARLGIEYRILLFPAILLLAAVPIAMVLYLRRFGDAAALPLAGLCGVVGMLGVYHRLYDQIMLFPLLLGNLVVAASSRRPLAIAIAVGLLISLTIPTGLIEKRPLPEMALAAVWLVAAAYPLVLLLASPPPERTA